MRNENVMSATIKASFPDIAELVAKKQQMSENGPHKYSAVKIKYISHFI